MKKVKFHQNSTNYDIYSTFKINMTVLLNQVILALYWTHISHFSQTMMQMAEPIYQILWLCQHNLEYHCSHQRSTLSSQETIALGSLQCGPNHDQRRHSKKLILHLPQCYHLLLEGHKYLKKI